ncbi:glucuronyl esterase domain-containing protein [Chitinophaga arvensicola]|uniref:4-O-methyl-glucuronoyl methylesterase-like domain-containing protein n=1 Tax=Chitinophaga arvensicola TaxID=29529 RepID=A0A1I0S716_9BACT|nr:acetylxylan esterase [Chitinophaga arvensicola]SEW51486.1 hypothetical protein SAMN04488122_4259 [Chitinophaga arvensicola]
MPKTIHVYLTLFILTCFASTATPAFAQEKPNYDEAKVGVYQLPDPLLNSHQKKVRTAADWEGSRRKEVLQLFKQHVFGQFPGQAKDIHFVTQRIDSSAVEGLAIAKQVRIYLTAGKKGPFIDLLLYVPAHTSERVPVFAGWNFNGNHNVSTDEQILISQNYLDLLTLQKKNAAPTRGNQEKNWPVKTLLQHGYGVATAYYGDVEPDHPQGWKTGIRSSLAKSLQLKYSDWCAIGAWAWGLSRMLDYLQTDNNVDAGKVIVLGHSRLGKAALWAAANDTRFAGVISNNSGEGGAAIARRNYGETLQFITTTFPHWFIEKYKSYAADVNKLPVDAHLLLALAAPRPLYVASATDDQWADPHGEFLAAKNAEPVYALYGKKGLGITQMPAPDTSIGNTIRYHIRTGVHDILLFDWMQYIRFADELVR